MPFSSFCSSRQVSSSLSSRLVAVREDAAPAAAELDDIGGRLVYVGPCRLFDVIGQRSLPHDGNEFDWRD